MTPKAQFEKAVAGIASRLQVRTLGQGHGIAEINDTDERLLVEALAAISAAAEQYAKAYAAEIIGEDEPETWFNKELAIPGSDYERRFLIEEAPIRQCNALRAEQRNQLQKEENSEIRPGTQ